MERKLELHNQIAALLNGENLALTYRVVNPDASQENANDWLQLESKQYYCLSNGQYTLHPTDQYLDVLNIKGLELYSSALVRKQREDFKAEFEYFYLRPLHSGSWFADEESKWYGCSQDWVEDDCKGAFNSWRNLGIAGVLKDGSSLYTSPCIFIGSDWCLTKSGSLYKLGKESDKDFVDKKIEEFKKTLNK